MIGAYKLTDLEAREGYLGIESQLEKSLAYLVSTKDKELIILMDGKISGKQAAKLCGMPLSSFRYRAEEFA